MSALNYTLIMLLALPIVRAQPEIRQVTNDASLIPASLPGGSLAPGSLFRINGVRLGPSPAVRASEWPLELQGVRVRFSSGSSTWDAPLSEVGVSSIRGRIPAEAPSGPVQISVVVDGQAGPAYPAQVAGAALGFYSMNGRGYGRAGAGVVRPGEAVTLRATGLDLQQHRRRIAVLIGGEHAQILSARGQSQGVQEITVEVPAGHRGCHVPLRGLIDGRIPTNTVTLSVSVEERDCPAAWESWRTAASGATFGLAAIIRMALRFDLADGSADASTVEYGMGAFSRLEGQVSPLDYLLTLPPPGSCITYAGAADLGSLIDTFTSFAREDQTPVNAGDLRIYGGASPAVVPSEGAAHSRKQVGGAFPGSEERLPLLFDPGAYQVKATGTSEIAPFAAAIRMPEPPSWRNLPALGQVNRDRALTLRWSPAARAEDMHVVLGLQIDGPTGSAAMFLCRERASKGRLTIPPNVLAVLPPARPDRNRSLGFLAILTGADENPARIQTQGLDFGAAYGLNIAGRTVAFE